MILKSDPPGPSSPESGGRTALLSELGERTRSVLGQLFTVPVKAPSLHTRPVVFPEGLAQRG